MQNANTPERHPLPSILLWSLLPGSYVAFAAAAYYTAKLYPPALPPLLMVFIFATAILVPASLIGFADLCYARLQSRPQRDRVRSVTPRD